jgi:ribonuclease J
VSRGFALESDAAFMQSARDAVRRTLETSSDEEKTDVGVMKEKIRADLKRFINRETQRRPMIMPVILEI